MGAGTRRSATATAFVFMVGLALMAASPARAGIPKGAGTYEDLVKLFHEFLAYRTPRPWSAAFADPDSPVRIADYSDQAVRERRRKLRAFQRRLDDMNVAAWDIHRQVDYLAVRAQLDKQDFLLNVSKPWARDPGFYVDQLLRISFENLEVEGDALARARERIRAVPGIVAAAKRNLKEGAAELARLAIYDMTHADGVGHGHPYRATPPQGVIGWYQDLLERAKAQQPGLVGDVTAAGKAVEGFHRWLVDNRKRMNGQAGVGEARLNWYLKHVKLMPYTSAQLLTLGKREWQRLSAFYALERHKNRKLPELEPAPTAEEYERRLRAADKDIRDWLVNEDIITLPDGTPDFDALGTNVPFIRRPEGLNFWEKIQFRDPHPDHLHAVIPGHRFDGWIERRNTHPIRSRIQEGSRVEGWGVYLEEGMMRAGVLEGHDRAKELIYLFGIFRAARVPADIYMQLNRMTVEQAVGYMVKRTPWLDRRVARVDAEIYLHRPPGYGLGYMIGCLQIHELLADRRLQLGDKFDLKAFHDSFLAAGRIPVSLIRWEITGLDDEVRDFWDREPIPAR